MNNQEASPKISKRFKKDVIVSVRLPKTLLDELKDIQQVNHFMDLSDEIRFVVRRYCLSFLNNQGQTSQPPMEVLLEQKRKEKLIDDLSKIIENLKGNKQNSVQSTKPDIQQNLIPDIEKNNKNNLGG
jgi:metal-responsive CopG/Arc/MetJ family transcriptional regulator